MKSHPLELLIRPLRFSCFLLVFLAGIIFPQAKDRDYLDAGPGKEPFDVTKRSVPKEAILGGGPPKDGIPAIDDPKFVKAEGASPFLKDKDQVIGVFENGQAKAYPVKILVWHEVVNDEIGGQPAAVSY